MDLNNVVIAIFIVIVVLSFRWLLRKLCDKYTAGRGGGGHHHLLHHRQQQSDNQQSAQTSSAATTAAVFAIQVCKTQWYIQPTFVASFQEVAISAKRKKAPNTSSECKTAQVSAKSAN